MNHIRTALATLAIIAIITISPRALCAQKQNLVDPRLPSPDLLMQLGMLNAAVLWRVEPRKTLHTIAVLWKIPFGCMEIRNRVGLLRQMWNKVNSTRRSSSIERDLSRFMYAVNTARVRNCGCDKQRIKTWMYGISQPPYGGGRRCLTEAEAAEFRRKGATVRNLGIPCTK